MPLSNSLTAYSDIPPILEAALTNGGASYRLPTRGQAVRWRQRAYTYRKLLLADAANRLTSIVDRVPPTTPYDTMRLLLEDDTVVITFDVVTGTLTDGAGEVLELPDVTTVAPFKDISTETEDEEGLTTALEVAQELGLTLDE